MQDIGKVIKESVHLFSGGKVGVVFEYLSVFFSKRVGQPSGHSQLECNTFLQMI